MAGLKFSAIVFFGLFLIAEGNPLKDKVSPVEDQLTSGTVVNQVVPDSEATASNTKTDLHTSSSFGLGYYYHPVIAPIVKYHYPFVYYHPTTYLHSIRHHGYGGYGFYQHGHGIIH